MGSRPARAPWQAECGTVWLSGDPLSSLLSPISVKFISKIQYVHSLEELEQLIPMEHVQLPDCVLQ